MGLMIFKKNILVFLLLVTASSFFSSCEQKQNLVVQNLLSLDSIKQPSDSLVKTPTPTTSSPVTEKANPIESIKVEPSVISLLPNQEETIKKIIFVRSDKTVSELNSIELIDEITSGDPSVATVTPKGVVKGIKAGVSPITLKLGNITQTLIVTVKAVPSPTPIPTQTAYKSLNVNKDYYLLKPFDTSQVILSATQEDGELNILIEATKADWNSTHTNVASVSKTGLITAWGIGSTKIKVTFGNLSKEFTVTVTSKSIDVPDNSTFIALGLDKDKYDLKPTQVVQTSLYVTLPNNDVAQVSNEKAEWATFNPSIASITPTGLITANSVGTTSMTVKYGGLSKTFLVTVTAP